MANQCPESLLKRDSDGHTPLHILCLNPFMIVNNDLVVAEYPEVVRIASNKEALPIHYLVGGCHQRPVFEAAMNLRTLSLLT